MKSDLSKALINWFPPVTIVLLQYANLSFYNFIVSVISTVFIISASKRKYRSWLFTSAHLIFNFMKATFFLLIFIPKLSSLNNEDYRVISHFSFIMFASQIIVPLTNSIKVHKYKKLMSWKLSYDYIMYMFMSETVA